MYIKFDPAVNMLTLIPEELNNALLDLTSFDKFISDFKNGKDAFESNYRFPLKNIQIDNKTFSEAH